MMAASEEALEDDVAATAENLRQVVEEFESGEPCLCVTVWRKQALRAVAGTALDEDRLRASVGALMGLGVGGQCTGVSDALNAVWSGFQAHGTLAQYVEYLEWALGPAQRNPRPCRDEKRRGDQEPSDSVSTRAIIEEVKRLRVRDAAQRQVADERAAKQFRLPKPEGLGTFLAEEPDEPSFHFQGLWPYGGLVVPQAPKKWGKSTLVRNVVQSALTGDAFLGRFAVTSQFQRILVIDMELTKRQFWDYWRGSGLTDEQVEIWRLRGSSSSMAIRSPFVRREIIKRMCDSGADMVIVDPLGPALRACEFAENSNDDFGRFLDLFDEMRMEAGVEAAMLPHHMGHTGEHGRGASVLGDKADAIWTGTFTKPMDVSGVRFLGATGRDVNFESTELAYDPATRRLSIHDFCRTRASIVQETKEEKKERERLERAVLIRQALKDNPEGFKSNADLTSSLGVTWNGSVLAGIKMLLAGEGLLEPGKGWHLKEA